MSGWEAIIAGAIGAASAYQSSKAAKKKNEAVHDEWERRMQYEEDKAARKQNSIGGRAAPYLAEQMLRLYGEKSAGRGGFTLPIDEMLANMNIKERQSGSYNGGSYRADPYSSNGKKPNYSGDGDRDLTDMLSAQMQAKSDYTARTGIQTRSGVASEYEDPTKAMRASQNGGASAGSLGSREETRGMGNTKTQTERGYTSLYRPGPNGVVDSTVEKIPNIEGDLATGGVGLFDEKNVDLDKLMSIGASLGITTGPKGSTINESGNYGNGTFERSDIMDWARSHKFLWAMAKVLGGAVAPGLPQIAQAGLNIADKRALKNKPTISDGGDFPYLPTTRNTFLG